MLRAVARLGVRSPLREFAHYRRSFSNTSVYGAEESKYPVVLSQLDKKWTAKWRNLSPSNDLHPTKHLKRSSDNNDKFYSLSMFPYPSGMLHMGHLRVYTISDVIARFHRLKGREVIHPMGWDAFGLPAENAAVERGIDPAVWTTSNIVKMKEQMNMMLADFDWDREVTTCSPDYYKWTQKIFLLMYEEGLAYRKEAEVNWDPIDQTVLANEQVDAEGRSWRSGAIVEKKALEQWFLGITKFAPELRKDLDSLADWPEKVKLMQQNWIGESHGAEIIFPSDNGDRNIKVFTTRPDTILSIQFVSLSTTHPITQEFSKTDKELEGFIQRCQDATEDSKDGYRLRDFTVQHPLNPDSRIPVFVAPYVLPGYGSGAVMGCPAHDERDFDFWSLNMPGSEVIRTVGPLDFEGAFTKKKRLNENARKYKGLSFKAAFNEVLGDLQKKGTGSPSTQYRLRDWLISRQRYWGAPIPIVHCEECGTVPVPDDELPVLLPEAHGFIGKSSSLAGIPDFVKTKCPSCGADAKRDTDTMDTFMDSSWYFFRYTDPKNETLPFSHEKATANMPVDMYIGGVEHAILHLLYSRFISKFLSKKGLWDGAVSKGEPIKRLVTQGMVHGKTYSNPKNGRFLKPDELDMSNPSEPKVKETGAVPLVTYEKMSKSKYNGADPAECIQKHGADATRAHILFQAAITDVLNWDESQIVGIERWLRRVVQLAGPITEHLPEDKESKNEVENIDEVALFNDLQTYTKSVTESMEESLSLNTVISDYMKLTNSISSALESKNVRSTLLVDAYKNLLVMISPVVPSVAEEAWEILSKDRLTDWRSIFHEEWPKFMPLVESNITNYSVFVNGKVRFNFEASKELIESEEQCIEEVTKIEGYEKWIDFTKVKKIIRKPNVISIVVGK